MSLGKKKSSKKIGDEAEEFVASVLRIIRFNVEIHPRTFRIIYLKGKQIQVSKDNDYYNLFDEKAERWDYMIYAQVKFEEEKNHVSKAQKNIDKAYPYEFPYQRIQTWQVWKEWVKPEKGRMYKEFRYRIQERKGFSDKFWKDDDGKYRRGNWVDIDLEELQEKEVDRIVETNN